MQTLFRVLDAELNRSVEAIRLLEDIFRFAFDDKELSSRLRDIRHKMRELFSFASNRLIRARESSSDVGVDISLSSQIDKRKESTDVMVANFKRAQEAFRSIEEVAKCLSYYSQAKVIEQLRFELYSIEKKGKVYFKPVMPVGLYAITDEKFSKGRDAIFQVRELCAAGIPIIQYREKYKCKKRKLADAREIRKITKDAGTLLVINDDIDIAIEVETDGVHVGQDDIPVSVVKSLVAPSVFVGLSTHCRKDYSEAVLAGADYVGVGPIFETYTKENVCAPVGLSYIKQVMENPILPFCAIGGIKRHNLDQVLELGVKQVAIVSEIVSADDIRETASSIHSYILNYIKKVKEE